MSRPTSTTRRSLPPTFVTNATRSARPAPTTKQTVNHASLTQESSFRTSAVCVLSAEATFLTRTSTTQSCVPPALLCAAAALGRTTPNVTSVSRSLTLYSEPRLPATVRKAGITTTSPKIVKLATRFVEAVRAPRRKNVSVVRVRLIRFRTSLGCALLIAHSLAPTSCSELSAHVSVYCLIWLECDRACLKCVGPASNNCILCSNLAEVQHQGACRSSCPDLFFPSERICYRTM